MTATEEALNIPRAHHPPTDATHHRKGLEGAGASGSFAEEEATKYNSLAVRNILGVQAPPVFWSYEVEMPLATNRGLQAESPADRMNSRPIMKKETNVYGSPGPWKLHRKLNSSQNLA